MFTWGKTDTNSPAETKRENKRLRQLVAEQAEKLAKLQGVLEAERRQKERSALDAERQLEERDSRIQVLELELKLQAGVIERDRQRVQAETAGHAAAIAVAAQAKQLRHGGQNGSVFQSEKDSRGS